MFKILILKKHDDYAKTGFVRALCTLLARRSLRLSSHLLRAIDKKKIKWSFSILEEKPLFLAVSVSFRVANKKRCHVSFRAVVFWGDSTARSIAVLQTETDCEITNF